MFFGQIIGTTAHAATLLWEDQKALAYFDRTLRGFWWSFVPAFLLLPIHLYFAHQSYVQEFSSVSAWKFYAVMTLSYVISWLWLPLLVFRVLEVLKKSGRFFDYMVPYHWAVIPQTLLVAMLELLRAAGFVGAGLEMLYFLSGILVLIYRWRIAKMGLQLDGVTTAGFIFLDILLSGVILGGTNFVLARF